MPLLDLYAAATSIGKHLPQLTQQQILDAITPSYNDAMTQQKQQNLSDEETFTLWNVNASIAIKTLLGQS